MLHSEATDSIELRFAEPEDVPAILALIKELAEYEHAADEVTATEEVLYDSLFEQHAAEVLIAQDTAGAIVGCAVFFRNFSTWTGRPGLYLEDLIVSEDHRRRGVGTLLMRKLAAICEERRWARFDWACLDWNTAGLGLYCGLGAARMDEWVLHRLTGEKLAAVAKDCE